MDLSYLSDDDLKALYAQQSTPSPAQSGVDLSSLSVDELKKLYQQHQDTTSAGQAAAIGAHQGATFGFSDELAGLGAASGLPVGTPPLISAPVGAVRRWLGSEGAEEAYRAGRDKFRKVEAAANAEHPIASTAGQVGASLGMGAGLAGAGLSLGANAARAGMGLGLTALGSTVDGAILGALGGAGNADEGGRLWGSATGGALGLGIGLAAPYAIAGASSLFRRGATPLPMSADRLAAARTLEQEGVPLTAGQKSGSRGLKYAESELGGGKISDVQEQQGKAFTDAIMRRAGGSGLADPDNLKALKDRLGQGFEDISARNTLTPDRQFGKDIGDTLNRYSRLLEAQQKPIINNVVDDLISRLGNHNGILPGTEYQAIRSDLSLAARSTSNPALSGAFKGIRNALDNAMDRSITPADAGKWKELRRQYGNYKTIQRASVGGGEDAGFGIISPARLRMAASSGNREGFSTGASDFTKLAKAGQAMMTPMPQSGTAPRARMYQIATSLSPHLVGASAGSAYGAKEGGLSGALAGAAAGAALPRVAGSILLSKPVQTYLTNQAFSKTASPQARAFASLLLTNAVLGGRDHK